MLLFHEIVIEWLKLHYTLGRRNIDSSVAEVLILPTSTGQSHAYVTIYYNQVQICSSRIFHAEDPDMFEKLSSAINFCMKEPSCLYCPYEGHIRGRL